MNNVKNKRVVLIGGAGFIGHNLAIKLKQLGAEVSIIDGMQVNNFLSLIDNTDNLPHPELSNAMIMERMKLLKNAKINLKVQDARNYHAISNLLTAIDPQVIIHLSAVSHANRSNKDPYSTFTASILNPRFNNR